MFSKRFWKYPFIPNMSAEEVWPKKLFLREPLDAVLDTTEPVLQSEADLSNEAVYVWFCTSHTETQREPIINVCMYLWGSRRLAARFENFIMKKPSPIRFCNCRGFFPLSHFYAQNNLHFTMMSLNNWKTGNLFQSGNRPPLRLLLNMPLDVRRAKEDKSHILFSAHRVARPRPEHSHKQLWRLLHSVMLCFLFHFHYRPLSG